MPRIACLRIPRFQIVVQQKHEQLKGKALALVNGKLTASGYSRARIFMHSQEADKYKIRNNMRLAEAKAQCADLILREQDEALYKIAEQKLVSELISCSPKVKVQTMGITLLDASGLTLQGGESQFCHNVLKLCSKSGYTDSSVGIANSAFAAIVASQINKKRFNIVPQKEDAKFLAPLSIQYLELSEEIENTLLTLGITTLGQLASIPVSELNKRFSKFSEIIWKPWELAQGIDNCQPTLPEIEKIYECFLDLGSAISHFSEITFALKSMLDRLINDLKQNGLCAQEIILSLYNDTNKFDERILPLMQSTNDAKFLLEIIRLSINAKPLTREPTSIKLIISRFTPEKWEQSILDKDEHSTRPTSNKLTQTELSLLQRFSTRLGKNTIFKAQASNQYLSENAGVWIPMTEDSNNSLKENLLPLDLKYLQEKGHHPIASDLVLRPTLPAAEVLVHLNNEKPAAINYKRRWYKVKSITNPEYLSCQWWSNAVAKDYYKIFVEPLAGTTSTMQNDIHSHNINNQTFLMLLTYDKLKNNWRIEGIYD